MKNSQVAHLWANQAKSTAKGSNFFFRDSMIFSYGEHYMAGKIHTVKGKCVALINSTKYSVTTGVHTQEVRGALEGLMPYLYSSDVTDIKKALKESLENAESYIESTLKTRIVRYKNQIKWAIENLKDHYRKLNAFRETIGLKAIGIDLEKLNAVKAHLKARHKRYLELNTPEMVAKREAEKARKAAKKLDKEIQAFRANEAATVRGLPHHLLRVKGDVIETSGGASVPLEAGLALYRSIVRGAKVDGKRVGGFTVNRIESLGTDKLLVIGCHRILLSEVQSTLGKVE